MKIHARRKQRSTRNFFINVYKTHSSAMVPANFDPEECHNFLPTETDRERAKEAYSFILNRVISKNDGQGYGIIPDFCEPVPVNHTIIKEIFGNDYVHYIDALKKSGTIVRHEKGRKGISSSTYYLGKKYRSQEVKVEKHSQEIIKKIQKSSARHFHENEADFIRYAHLVHWFTTGKITIDTDEALKCELKIEEGVQQKLIELGNEKKLEKFNKTASTRKSKLKAVVSKIEENRYSIKIDRNLRLHTVLSSMPESMRCFLKYDNQEIIAVDISNSQPFHFCYLFNIEFWSARQHTCSLKAIHPGLYTVFDQAGQLTKIRQLIRQSRNHKDVANFLMKAKSGEIYEEISERYGERYASLRTREKAKVEFITFLNFDLTKKEHSKYGGYRQFARDYPTISGMMELVKGSHYKDISTILQLFEAKMFLIKCGREFERLYPEVPLFSIHDTMITLKSYQKRLGEVISTTYLKHLGFQPKVKVSELNPDAANSNIQKHVIKRVSKLT